MASEMTCEQLAERMEFVSKAIGRNPNILFSPGDENIFQEVARQLAEGRRSALAMEEQTRARLEAARIRHRRYMAWNRKRRARLAAENASLRRELAALPAEARATERVPVAFLNSLRIDLIRQCAELLQLHQPERAQVQWHEELIPRRKVVSAALQIRDIAYRNPLDPRATALEDARNAAMAILREALDRIGVQEEPHPDDAVLFPDDGERDEEERCKLDLKHARSIACEALEDFDASMSALREKMGRR